MMHVASKISDHKFTVRNLIFRGVGQDFSHAVMILCDWTKNRLKVSASPLNFYKSQDIYFPFRHSIFVHLPRKVFYSKLILKVKMPGFNSESRQVTHDSQGLRVTVRIADDSTSNSNNNNNNAADDSTSDLTNVINNSDDLTSSNNSDDLTSVSPTVVPIGRAGRLARPNNVSNPSPVGHGVGRGGIVRNPSYISNVGRGVGRGQPIQRNPQPSTSAPSTGREVGGGAGRGGRYFHPYRRPATQTSASTINGTRTSSVIFINSDGEEVEEEEDFDETDDDYHYSTCVEHLFRRRRVIFDINERYAESLIVRQIQALERQNLWLRNECQRLNTQLQRCRDLLSS